MIEIYKNKVLQGESLTDDEAYSLLNFCGTDSLYEAAAEITRTLNSSKFDSCSIINVKSGRCPENCKWCAQSAHYSTGCDIYGVVEKARCVEAAKLNHDNGIHRFSLVASGKAIKGKELDEICDTLNTIRKEVGISTCASLGLLNEGDFMKLYNAGVRRYHCNLETSPSYFPTLCSTHSIEDKIKTIEAAKRVGMEVCSGGIIGMGESARQRVEFALTLRMVGPASVPINILSPIPGTPLADQAPLSEQEILDTIAIFRFILPTKQLRFAGGRAALSRDSQLKALKIGINGGIVGDLLTTIGSRVKQDKALVEEAGMEF